MDEELRPSEALMRDYMNSNIIVKRSTSEEYFYNLVGKFKLNLMNKFISF